METVVNCHIFFMITDLLVDCFELCSKIHSMARISDQCESGEYGISVQVSLLLS